MKSRHVVNVVGLLGFARRHKSFVVHYLLFLFCFVLGVFTVDKGSALTYVQKLLSEYSSLLASGFLPSFLTFLIVSVAFTFLIFVSGFFVLGSPVCICMFMLFGLGTGCVFAANCRLYGFGGMLINLACYLVPALTMFAVTASLSSKSMYASAGLVCAVTSGKFLPGFRQNMKDLFVMFAVSVPIAAVASAIRALLLIIYPM